MEERYNNHNHNMTVCMECAEFLRALDCFIWYPSAAVGPERFEHGVRLCPHVRAEGLGLMASALNYNGLVLCSGPRGRSGKQGS